MHRRSENSHVSQVMLPSQLQHGIGILFQHHRRAVPGARKNPLERFWLRGGDTTLVLTELGLAHARHFGQLGLSQASSQAKHS